MIDVLRAELRKNVDFKYREGSYNYFKESIKLYGVRNGIVRKLSAKYFPKSKDDLLVLCDKLWKSGFMEEGTIAVDWARRGKIRSLDVFEKWIDKYVNNWAHDDDLCGHLIGPLLIDNPALIPRVKSWFSSSNRWKRRACAVSFVVPARKGLYLEDIFDVALKLLKDKDDLVQKGYGWMLKEASHLHQKEVFEFVMSHKNAMPRTALRYAIEKLPDSLRRKAMN